MSYFKGPSTRLRFCAAFFMSGWLAACADPILGISGVAQLAPTVTAVAPLAQATSVPINTKIITAAFSKSINPATLTTSSLSVACPTGLAITGTVSYATAGNVATLTLPGASNLPPNATCTATLTTAIEDSFGLALASDFAWNFTTGVAPDTTAPTVTSTVPVAGATGVAINSLITASFSEPMNALTIVPANFSLACPVGAPITGTVGYAVGGNVATFTPNSNLPNGTTCTATISTGARDVAGNALAAPYTWTFTTGAAPDTTAPTVTSTAPAAGATGVAINALITASFSEAMDPLTITTANFTLACPVGAPIVGTVGYAVGGNVATFTPTSNLPNGTTCTAIITTGARDVAGNPLVAPYTWNFTTGVAPDTTAPTVTSTVPVAGATGVAINSLITASFSEPMNALTIVPANFSLACPVGAPITGTVGYAVGGNVATFTPTSNLPALTLCTANLTTSVRDVAGNPLASAFSWSFTTGAAPDTTPPTVAATNPADLGVGVCINKTINVTFSEAMAPLSITTANFTLMVTGGALVTGVVAYDVPTRIATFRPDTNLIGTPSTNYTATIKGGATGVTDLAGNPLAADRVITFNTNASTCPTAPPLGAAAPFGSFAGTTVTSDGLNTVINGDVGVTAASTTITGLRDSGGNVYTITPNNNGLVNGLVYSMTAPPLSVAGAAVTQARLDALQAFNSISPGILPGGIDVSNLAQCPSCGGVGGGANELAGRTLPPGIYRATGNYTVGVAIPGSLTLDAGGDTNAVWIFQSGTLTVGLTGPATPAVPIQVLLLNGAQSKNVFWHIPAGAAVGTGSTMVGTLLSDAVVTFSTTGGSPPTAVTTTLNGRAVSLSAGVTMTNTVINVPTP